MAKVLVVDDEPQVARALYRLLRREGFEAMLAFGPAEALERLAAFEPDVVLSDYRMPGMTGAELLAQVRLLRPTAVRIILSGQADVTAISASLKEGDIARFLSKPWDDAALVRLLRELLARGRVGDCPAVPLEAPFARNAEEGLS
ncbi:MAG: response regulator [Deltaproteobacteria bacterium]